MTRRLRILVLAAAAAALAACGASGPSGPGLLLGEPSAVAAFHGLTGLGPKYAGNAHYPYFAIAGSSTNEITILDAKDDTAVPAPVALRSLVIPAPGKPALLASADLGDHLPDGSDYKPDLLVAVSSGDSRLQLIQTWKQGGGVEPGAVDLGSDIVAIVSLPSAPGTARVAAALAGEKVAIVEYKRALDGVGIAVDSTSTSAELGFQPVALATMPGDATKLYAATRDPMPPSNIQGVAELDVSVTPPVLLQALDAKAPTRLVAAAPVRTAISTALGKPAFELTPGVTVPAVPRVFAILDESGCGPAAAIACGLVALDPVTAPDPARGHLVPDPAGELAWQAPLPIPGLPIALGAALPPSLPPSTAAPDADYAGTLMRVQTAVATRATSAVAAVASTNGSVYFVDLGRWELPSEQVVHSNVAAAVASPQGRVATPSGSTPVNQWLVLVDPDPLISTVPHGNAAGLAHAVTRTPGYTPTEHWAVTYQGALPGLSSRRAEAAADGTLALQVSPMSGSVITESVHLYDPTLGVAPGDTVVIDPTVSAELPARGCTAAFEAEVDVLLTSSAAQPGGAVQLRKKLDPAHPEWDACVDALAGGASDLRATFLAGAYVLTKGTGTPAVYAGRPQIGVPFSLAWAPETTLSACNLPPASPWPAPPAPACDDACRADCEKLVQVRMARRIAYPEPCGADGTPAQLACIDAWLIENPSPPPVEKPVTGPALGFTLALENPGVAPPRGLTLTIDTNDGRNPFHAVPPLGAPVDPRAVATFDRSPHDAGSGTRVLVPYASGVVLDATPTVQGGNPVSIQ